MRPRQETQPTLSASASTTTVISRITQTVDITSILSSTTTRSATSTVLTILYQTATRVLDAQTTVSVTSTLTVHPPKPTTITKTEFASLPAESAPSSTSSTRTPGLAIPTGKSSSDDSTVLSTPAIAGIAAGGFVALLVALGIALLICLKRRRRRQAAAAAARVEDDLNAYYGIIPPVAFASARTLRREPKMPPADIFAPTSPQHHGAAFQFQPAAGAAVPAAGQHERAVSSHTAATTLVGSAGSPVPRAKSPRASSVQPALSPSPPAEVAGLDVPPRYEVEGSSPPVGSQGAGNGGGSWGEAHRRTGSDDTGRRNRRSDGGYFAINF